MGGWIKDLISGLIETVLNALTSAAQATLNWVLGLLSASVFSSPDVTALPQVSYVSGGAQLVANAFMALIVMVVGILAMTHGGVQERYSLKELLPRMLIGLLAANMATPVVRAVITGANALTEALAGGAFTSQDSFTQIRRVITGSTSDPAMSLLALVLSLLVIWMLVMVVVTWLGRLTVLLVVAGTAPVALMCHALPQTEPVARTWWRSLFSCLAVQVLQAVTLHMAVATLLSSDANLPAVGLPHDPTGLFNMLIACFVLWLVIRIPNWVARNFGGNAARGASIVGHVARVVVVQQLLSAMGLRGGRRLRGRSAATGPRPPTTHLHSHQHSNSHQHLHIHPPRSPRSPGPGNQPSRRVPAWVGQAPTARPHPGRPPRTLEGRPPLPPPATRRVIGPADHSGRRSTQ